MTEKPRGRPAEILMPRMDGREALEAIVADEALKSIPVVVLTTSADEREVLKMYKLHCNSYIVKPVDLDQFLQVVRSLGEYWFELVVLPRGEIREKEKAPMGA